MYSIIPRLDGDFTQIPNDLYLIVKSSNQQVLLETLITLLQGKNKSSYASLQTLGKRLHLKNRNSIEQAIQALKASNYIDYKKGSAEKNEANEYWVNMDAILATSA